MNKQVTTVVQGHRADIGEYMINRILPNKQMTAVGPFVFLDHLMPSMHGREEKRLEADGKTAHPHRGIATLTYVINGEANHYDSRGQHAVVRTGGVQWMKAGNGIVHDESFNVDEQSANLLTHGMQFWINLPAKNKAETPDYLPLQDKDIPKRQLGDAGWLKVVAGEYENLVSGVPAYTKQFIYHVHLQPGKTFTLPTEAGIEYAVFLPVHNALIDGAEYSSGEIIGLDTKASLLNIGAPADKSTEVMIIGGEHYNEPIAAYGPFVMNSEEEISEAYNDFYSGKYGKISYSK